MPVSETAVTDANSREGILETLGLLWPLTEFALSCEAFVYGNVGDAADKEQQQECCPSLNTTEATNPGIPVWDSRPDPAQESAMGKCSCIRKRR